MQNGIDFQIDEPGIAVIRVNRPQARNALDWTTQTAFAEAVTAVSQNEMVRVLIITGTGDHAFVAGGDLKELSQHPETAAGARLNAVMSAALLQLTQLPVPVIAAVNGDAIGGGCEILTACDLCLAAPHVHFGFAQVRVALTTGWGGTARLVRLIGQSRATELLLTARRFDVTEAMNLGLIHRIIPDGTSVLVEARIWARELTALPRQALAATKQLVQTAVSAPLATTYAQEHDLFIQLWSQPDHLEALAAFVEKRKPVFNQ